MGINHAKREISRGVGKIKLKRLNETLENERGKFSQLKEEADRRGLKFDYNEEEYENGQKKEKKAETKTADKKEVRDSDGDKIPEGFDYFKGKEGVYNWTLLHASEAWQAGLEAGGEVIVAYMPTEIQKQKSWPDDYDFFSSDGRYATIRRRYGQKDEFEFFMEKEDAFKAAQKLIDQSAGSDNSSQGDDEDDYDDSDLTEDIAKIVHKYEEGAEVEEVDTYDFGDVFSDLRHTGEAYRIKDDYLGDLVIVPLYEQSFEHNKRVLGIKTNAKEGYALFVGNNPPEFYKTVEEAAKWAGEAIKDGYYEQNYDEDGNELAKPKPNKPKLGEAPMS